MKQTEFYWQTATGGEIYAVEWRPEGTAKAVVALVHGIGEHCHRYDHVAVALGKAGVGMVGMDHPGHGRSAGPRGHSPYALVWDQIDRLVSEARARFPGLPVFLYGHSLGGSLGLSWILDRKPSIAGAIIGSPGLAPADVPAAKIAIGRLMAMIMPTFALSNGLDVEGISRDPEVVMAYRADPLVHDRVSARLGIDILDIGPMVIARATEITIPLLLVQGSADRIVDPAATGRFAAAAGKNVTYRVFEGWYHELHNEPGKEKVFALFLDWMKASSANK